MRVRMTLDLSTRMNETLERMAARQGRTKTDVIRIALELFFSADEAREEGFTVGAYRETGTLREERVFIMPR